MKQSQISTLPLDNDLTDEGGIFGSEVIRVEIQGNVEVVRPLPSRALQSLPAIIKEPGRLEPPAASQDDSATYLHV
ncbi:hypothetical protein SRHO_G00276440 [Serrasalmus rhombeus]